MARHLAARHPRRLWFAHFPIHHIEALIERNTPSPHDVLGQTLLTLLRARGSPIDLLEIQTWLCLDAGLVNILIDRLQSQGVLRRTADHTITLCSSACVDGAVAPRLRERKVFHFTDGEPPLFVPLAESACAALMPPATWAFDLTCLQRPVSLSPYPGGADNHFDEDVCRLLLPDDLPSPSQAEAVALDRAEQTLLVLVQTDDLLGFAVSPEGWELHREPALSLPMNADLSLALTAPLTAEQWRQAWQVWCQQRSLPRPKSRRANSNRWIIAWSSMLLVV